MTDYSVHCDCGAVSLTMTGAPRVKALCHCEDCRNLLQVPFHSVTAWLPEQINVTKGEQELVSFQHPQKKMKRVFCKHCGDVMYNTNAFDWKLVSQLMVRKCNDGKLPPELEATTHFFYDRRLHDISDDLHK